MDGSKRKIGDVAFCHDCKYCLYTNIDDGWAEFYWCTKQEDWPDVEYTTEACKDFEERTEW